MSSTGAADLHAEFAVEPTEVRVGQPVVLTLTVTNTGAEPVHLLVPRGRADGLRLAVRQDSGSRLADLDHEPDGGLVPEVSLAPGQAHRQEFPLSQWLTVTDPGRYDVECTLPVGVATASLRERSPERREEVLDVHGVVRLTVVPA